MADLNDFLEAGMIRSNARLQTSNSYRLGSAALFSSIAVILGALGFEHLGGLKPCELCLQQRYAYYAGIPLLFAALVLVAAQWSKAAAALFLFVSMLFLANAGFALYHVGVEEKFWPGPASCAAAGANFATQAGDLVKQLAQTRVVPCDAVQWRLLGLSLAGWNIIACMLLTIISLQAAFAVVKK